MKAPISKSAAAFRTISEVSDGLDVPQHVLRFWETKFPQIRPLKRGGGRRYYRPEDVELLRRIQSLLYQEGYTIKGVQRLLKESRGALPPGPAPIPTPEPADEAAHDTADEAPAPFADRPENEATKGAAPETAEAPFALPDAVRREIAGVIEELRALQALLAGKRG